MKLEGFGMPSHTVRCLRIVLSLLVLLTAGIAQAQPAFQVKDINTNTAQSPSVIDIGRKIAALGNGFLFAVDDAGAYGTELWRSDGTPAGTTLLKDICPGSC